MTRSDRRRNDEGILRAAAQLLAVDAGASVQAVADAAGVSRLSVYRRYPDRDALVAALRDAADAELDEALAELPSWSEGPGGAGDTGGAGGAETLLILTTRLASVAARYPVALLRHSPGSGVPPRADARVADLLRAGQEAGVIRPDVPATTLNAVLFGVLSALLDIEHRARPDIEPDGPALARDVLGVLSPGLLADPAETPPTPPVRQPATTRSPS